MWYTESKKDSKSSGLIGLLNLGNTCYMSAALQALFNCPALTNYFLTCLPSIKLCKKNDLSLSYQHLVTSVWDSEELSSHVNPLNLLKIMRIHYPQFRGYNQCDPQEFLRCFMDLLHNELKEKLVLSYPPLTEDSSDNESIRRLNSGFSIVKTPNTNQLKNYGRLPTSHPKGAHRPPPTLRNLVDDTSSQSSSMDYETCDSGHGSELEDNPLALRMAILALSTDCHVTGSDHLESDDFSSSYNDTSTLKSLPVSPHTVSVTPSLEDGDDTLELTITKADTCSAKRNGQGKQRKAGLKFHGFSGGRREVPRTRSIIKHKMGLGGAVNTRLGHGPRRTNAVGGGRDHTKHLAEQTELSQGLELRENEESLEDTLPNTPNGEEPPIGESVSASTGHRPQATAYVVPFERSGPSPTNQPSPGAQSGAHVTSPTLQSPRIWPVDQGQAQGSNKNYTVYRSVVSDLFDGVMISTVECLTCHTISKTVEVFQDLSLPIPTSGQLSNLRTKCYPNNPLTYGGHVGASPTSRKNRRLGGPGGTNPNEGPQQHFPSPLANDGMPPEMGSNQKSLCLLKKSPTSNSLSSTPNPPCHQNGASPSFPPLNASSITTIASWIIEWIRGFLPFGMPITLQNCLSSFFACDELNGDNMYSCDNCKKLRNGIKESKIIKLPEILCIHLKRFRHDFTYSSKVSTKIDFPLEDLDMSHYLDKNCRDRVTSYNLVAIICHHGTSLASGHYTTYALNYFDGHWYEFDDECVTRVKEFSVEKAEPYVLFYGKNQEVIMNQRIEAARLQTDYHQETKGHLPFYMSKRWLNKFNYMSEPGPIDHNDFVCAHRAIKPDRFAVADQLCQDVGINTWIYLLKIFKGAGPINCLKFCRLCEEQERQKTEKRREEHRIYNEYMRLVQSSDPYQDFETYVINLSWFKAWEDFIKGQESDPPGPIDNRSVLKVKDDQVTLNKGTPVCHIYENLWKFLVQQYGGGPEIPSQHNHL